MTLLCIIGIGGRSCRPRALVLLLRTTTASRHRIMFVVIGAGARSLTNELGAPSRRRPVPRTKQSAGLETSSMSHPLSLSPLRLHARKSKCLLASESTATTTVCRTLARRQPTNKRLAFAVTAQLFAFSPTLSFFRPTRTIKDSIVFVVFIMTLRGSHTHNSQTWTPPMAKLAPTPRRTTNARQCQRQRIYILRPTNCFWWGLFVFVLLVVQTQQTVRSHTYIVRTFLHAANILPAGAAQ